MLVTPVNTAHQTVPKTRALSWDGFARNVSNMKANDNPAMEVTKRVPAPEFKGQFVDLLS